MMKYLKPNVTTTKVKLTFITPLLGTMCGNPQVARDHILSKSPHAVLTEDGDPMNPERMALEEAALPKSEEIEGETPEEIRKATTYFYRDPDRNPAVLDYQYKGHFKGAMEAIAGMDMFTKEELKKYGHGLHPYRYKKTIDQLIMVRDIFHPIQLAGPTFFVERPIRVVTMKGERVALSRSEAAPEGSTLIAEFHCYNPQLVDWIYRWLDYAEVGGFLQWRSGGNGRFTWEIIT